MEIMNDVSFFIAMFLSIGYLCRLLIIKFNKHNMSFKHMLDVFNIEDVLDSDRMLFYYAFGFFWSASFIEPGGVFNILIPFYVGVLSFIVLTFGYKTKKCVLCNIRVPDDMDELVGRQCYVSVVGGNKETNHGKMTIKYKGSRIEMPCYICEYDKRKRIRYNYVKQCDLDNQGITDAVVIGVKYGSPCVFLLW